jgi:hypothetical protein
MSVNIRIHAHRAILDEWLALLEQTGWEVSVDAW